MSTGLPNTSIGCPNGQGDVAGLRKKLPGKFEELRHTVKCVLRFDVALFAHLPQVLLDEERRLQHKMITQNGRHHKYFGVLSLFVQSPLRFHYRT
jgi:hypothetical protein